MIRITRTREDPHGFVRIALAGVGVDALLRRGGEAKWRYAHRWSSEV
jgi:hypothetical protein